MPETDDEDRWRDLPLDLTIPDPDAEGLIPETPLPEDDDDADS
jgi:hypothetical protein